MFAKNSDLESVFEKPLSSVTISPDTRGRKADPEKKIFFFKKNKNVAKRGYVNRV